MDLGAYGGMVAASNIIEEEEKEEHDLPSRDYRNNL
jgi:hypothetical protein